MLLLYHLSRGRRHAPGDFGHGICLRKKINYLETRSGPGSSNRQDELLSLDQAPARMRNPPHDSGVNMPSINEIDIHQVKEMEENQSATIVDIRDPASYRSRHIPNAVHLSDENVEQFVAATDKEKPLVVYCYHGISSQGAAAYFTAQGFREVYSMTGGFENWRAAFPDSGDPP